MNIKGILHIGIAHKKLEEAKKLFSEVLGLRVTHEGVYEEATDICCLEAGGIDIELFADRIPPEGLVSQVITEYGEGINHIAFEVEDLHVALEELRAKGIPIREGDPRPGLHGNMIAFLDPSVIPGYLVELVQVIEADS
jgi:methylmalonyl-CoA/ethylmalonyl-CoA epimerase